MISITETGSGTKGEKKLSATVERFCRRFSLAEIQSATQDFSEAHLIGHGGFGKVYKGQIDNGEECVAIKRLSPNSNQGEGEFLMEIETLSKLRHINLVSLIGYCSENGELILVYEYIARGTLADHLFTLSRGSESDDYSSLTWKQRLNICIGAARGIDYLHTGTSIIHRDVKSTNILLDEIFTAKVSDFGLAKHLSSSKSHVSTAVKGTFGYLDPDYFTTGRLTRKSDTYAFGVVLLEVLCGRPAVDPSLGEDDMGLVMWARKKISKRKADQIVASNLRDEISSDCLKTFVGITKRCLNREPKKRPTMAQAVAQLEFALEQEDRKAPTLNASQFLPFWSRVKPSGSSGTGSSQQERKQGDVNPLSITTQEEALKGEHTVNMLPITFRPIPMHELKDITDNFSSECLIDKRSNGNVYRGTLKSGQVVAIKKLYSRSSLPEKEFLEQVSFVSNLKHENVAQLLGYCLDGYQQFLAYEFAPQGSLHDILHVVCSLKHEHVAKLFGYCVDGRRQLLAYEFAENGSLHDILHGQGVNSSKRVPVLSWGQRVKIAMGAAKGLEYIHEKSQIHGNIRSSNVLVFDANVVKLAYFRQATRSIFYDVEDYDEYRSHRHPEYTGYGRLSWRTDVYSFGVVLLELLTGDKLFGNIPNKRDNIGNWVKEFVDAKLNGDYPVDAVANMAAVTKSCMEYDAESRPDMSYVVRALSPLLND